jgi:hypothetical protein
MGGTRSVGCAFVSDEMVRESLGGRRLMRFARDLAPLPAVEGRESGVALKIAVDLGEMQDCGTGQRRTLESFTADDEYRVWEDRER